MLITLELTPAVRLAVLGAGSFLLAGLLTGIWKYAAIARSRDARAPAYVDIAHRAALMYSFASLVIAALALLSPWSAWVTLAAVAAPLVFFALAIASYVIHGLLDDTDNQFARPHRLGGRQLPAALLHGFMLLLIMAETGGVAVLLLGAIIRIGQ